MDARQPNRQVAIRLGHGYVLATHCWTAKPDTCTDCADVRGTVDVADIDVRAAAEVPRLLERVDLPDWRAYGVAAFELYGDIAHRDRYDSDPVLLHLIVRRSRCVSPTGRPWCGGPIPPR